MNQAYLDEVRKTIPDARVLINAVCQRATELAHGGKPLVRVLPDDERNWMDIALEEFAIGKVAIAMGEREDSPSKATDEEQRLAS